MFEELEVGDQPNQDELRDFCVAVAVIAASDEKVVDAEQAYLAEVAEGLGVDLEAEEVAPRIREALTSGGGLDQALAYVLHPSLKKSLFRVMVSMAAVDEALVGAELERLEEAGKRLGLDPEATGDYLQWAQRMRAMQAKLQDILGRL
jgi:DnaJ-domain-containing protein 1